MAITELSNLFSISFQAMLLSSSLETLWLLSLHLLDDVYEKVQISKPKHEMEK